VNPKKVSHDSLKRIGLSFVLLLSVPAARAQGLSQASTIMSTLQSNLTTLIPVIATVALMIIGLFYAMRMIHKDAFVHWFVGILIVGSAAEITAMIVG
jgi:type IV secretory pathway VirB2 component (pilin)